MKSGINTILNTIDFTSIIKDADVVFTGEGRLDSQSFQGKVIDGIANYTAKAKVPLIALVGQIRNINESDYPEGLTAVYPISGQTFDLEQAIRDTAKNLKSTMLNICHDWKKPISYDR
ncbi:MAG: glycerate kinase [Candidatus Izemoplasmatales bacterium]|nr:glycerate kinase [Candidatus Izemoplasmatales bacterium]